MDFHNAGKVSSEPGSERVFRQGSIGKFAAFFVTATVGLGFTMAPGWNESQAGSSSLGTWFFYYIGCVLFLLSLLILWYARASLHNSNWLLRLQPDGLWIKFRSHLNDHFPKEDLVVLELGLMEIDWVRKFRHTQSSPTIEYAGDVERLSHWTYLELGLARSVDIDIIKAALQSERNRQAPQTGFTRGHHRHYPVTLMEPRTLRLEWNGITPGIDAALSLLGKYFPVQQDEYLRSKPWNELEKTEMEARIIDLASKGKTLDAITLVKIHYGMNLTEAKRFVEELNTVT